MRLSARAAAWAAGALVALLGVAALEAPALYPEWLRLRHGPASRELPRPSYSVSGEWVDDWYVVERIDASTFAIGEPRYYQGNVSYLIVGAARAVLYDAGPGVRDLAPVVARLTALPVTVVPSHLHFDHVGALGHVGRTALLDLPALRGRIRAGRLTLRREEFLGYLDGLAPPTFPVDEWWPAGATVDLGGRALRVIATPGHTPDSLALYDAARHQLFAGDFAYPGHLYAFLPGASRKAYLESTRRLLATIDPLTRIYAGHAADPAPQFRAPVLGTGDLKALATTLEALAAGRAAAGAPGSLETVLGYPRVYPIRDGLSFATGFAWNNR
jgi:glyoxylase-like metal-dependent hydrolase (beta-lactamase superfamily II)